MLANVLLCVSSLLLTEIVNNERVNLKQGVGKVCSCFLELN